MVKSKFNIPDLKDFLDEKSYQYESLEFIKDDPILNISEDPLLKLVIIANCSFNEFFFIICLSVSIFINLFVL